MPKKKITKILNCRICNKTNLLPAISLGGSPLANSFLTKKQLKYSEPFFPLEVVFCQECGLLQLSHVVNPNLLFKNYLYVSSTSPIFINHFNKFARDIKKKFKLKKTNLIVDIGSNDGILLKPFKRLGMKVLGVDPAENLAQIAEEKGITTIKEFFNPRIAKRIVKKYSKAKIITATNVFAHVNDLNEFMDAVKILLDDNGSFIIEVPYLVDFIEKNLFDTIYHEHLSYFSLKPLTVLFKKYDMEIFDVKRVESHGGSIRIFIKNAKNKLHIKETVQDLLAAEDKLNFNKLKTYTNFSKKIAANKKNLIALLKKIKKNKKHIAGFGAPAKGNTLLNYFHINSKYLDYIIDDNKFKQELFTPGTHIPIYSPNRLLTKKVDYLLILAWNFSDPIIKRYNWFSKNGGKFILPIPAPTIL